MTCLTLHLAGAVRQVTSDTSVDQWRRDRLTEARGILADAAHHPDTLLILAARVIAGQSDDAAERAEAIDLGRFLCRRPLQATAAAVCPQGGAA